MANQGGSERQVQVEETVAVAVTRLQLEDTDQKGTQLRPPSSPRTADTAGASAHDSGAAAHAAAVKMESDCDEGQGAVAASARRSPASAWPASKSPSAAASRDHSHTTPMGAGAAVTPIATATTATASLTATATPPSPAVASQISKAATPVKLESHDSDYEPCQITFTPSPKREDPTPRARSRSRSRSISRSRSGSRSGSRSRGRGLISARNSESSASTPVPGTKSPPAAVKQRPLYGDLPDATEDARRTFEVLPDCTYASKWLGRNDEAMHCDCVRDIDPVTGINRACGTDCVNVATKIECPSDSLCGPDCQNQRFTNHRYADVSVFKTEKKGFGLRANADLRAGDFIYEYIGEVIGEQAFRRRMVQYDQEGIKHFYFMSLEAGVFVDATKKGNLGRFCNHSCNPNCYVDKWIVGDRLRMGIFAGTNIQAGEELVFNYNVDRY
ncbi:histone methyltransferase set2, partial [Ascosphaera acerosa]